ncbi:hypothetical protein [Streptomyces fulvorobeus]|uniref:Uncharacterized protein n=1 Tax=Streptomyces fulvorobeus TaxID=284028 RepID=A0A7J0BZD2_9ACTN|nr:hypothetical protein [Streptomyces fulvorobeus]NYE39363.1 hypothetical protein [Streptomyces fulvorobeus]GFM95581.1 hypothetical protein Sfulv_03920 [Streptomyces fulvorobeus]
MTSLMTLAATDASAAPGWLHLLVMAAAVLILVYNLARRSS